MRISDWSSDVCSSDLWRYAAWDRAGADGALPAVLRQSCRQARGWRRQCRPPAGSAAGPCRPSPTMKRSEEHTSELQSLMRISYAAFCLKKKIQKQIDTEET